MRKENSKWQYILKFNIWWVIIFMKYLNLLHMYLFVYSSYMWIKHLRHHLTRQWKIYMTVTTQMVGLYYIIVKLKLGDKILKSYYILFLSN